MTCTQVEFDKVRQEILAAKEDRDAAELALVLKYGNALYATKAEFRKLAKKTLRYERAGDRMWAFLEGCDRDWKRGVARWWVLEKLPYADAFSPLDAALSVEPVKSRGY